MSTKINLGQPLLELNGEPIRMGNSLDSRTLGVVAQALATLPEETRAAAIAALNAAVAKPLTLSVAITSALTAIYKDELEPGRLQGPERLLRFDLARRCNREGLVRLDGAQIKKCKEMIERYFPGSLVAPQAELLLDGRALELAIDDGEDD